MKNMLVLCALCLLGGALGKSSVHPSSSGESARAGAGRGMPWPGRRLVSAQMGGTGGSTPGSSADVPDGFEKGKEREIKTLAATDTHAIIQASQFVKEQNQMIGQFSSSMLGLKKLLYVLSEKDIVLLDEEVQNGFLTEMVESQDKGTTYAMVILTEMRTADKIFQTLEFPVWEMRNVTTWQSNDLSFRKTLHFHVPERVALHLSDRSLPKDTQASVAAVNKQIRKYKQHPLEQNQQVVLGKVIFASRQSLEMNFRNLFQEYEEVSSTPTDISVTYVLFTTLPTGSVVTSINEREWLSAVYRDSTGHVTVVALKETIKSPKTQCADYLDTWSHGCDGKLNRRRPKSASRAAPEKASLFEVVFESLIRLGGFLAIAAGLAWCIVKKGGGGSCGSALGSCMKSSKGLELLSKSKAANQALQQQQYQSAGSLQGTDAGDEFGNDDL